MTEEVYTSKTSVYLHETTRRYIPEICHHLNTDNTKKFDQSISQFNMN
jgi:hypothetical protein